MQLPALYNHLDAMQWRYATRAYDTNQKLDRETIYALLEILRLTPTTLGLQLWRFVVVDHPDLFQKLSEHCIHIQQGHKDKDILTASHLIVFARPEKFEPALIEQHIEFLCYTRQQPISEMHSYRRRLQSWVEEQQTEDLESWMNHQVFTALGSFIAACATARIDSCPIESFHHEKFDEILDLKQKHWKSVVACSVGIRDPQDANAKLKKIRFPIDDLVLFRGL